MVRKIKQKGRLQVKKKPYYWLEEKGRQPQWRMVVPKWTRGAGEKELRKRASDKQEKQATYGRVNKKGK